MRHPFVRGRTPLSRPAFRHLSAFALPELLVVTGVIAVLALLVLPVVARTGQSNGRMVCGSNLKALAMAVQMYSDDSRDYLPWPGWGEPMNTYLIPGWLYTPGGPNSTTESLVDVRDGQLWRFLQSSNLYRCSEDNDPAAHLAREARQRTGTGHNQSSYVMNGAVSGYSDGTNLPDGGRGVTHLIRAFRPDDFLLWAPPDGPTSFNFQHSGILPAQGISERHAFGGWIGRIDGALEWLTVDEFYSEVDKPVRNRAWCNPLSATGR